MGSQCCVVEWLCDEVVEWWGGSIVWWSCGGMHGVVRWWCGNGRVGRWSGGVV